MYRRVIVAAQGLLCACFVSGVSAQSLETTIMPGQVIQGHAKYESECKNCHVRFNRAAQPGLCLDCHKDIARDISQRRRYHSHYAEKECRACHTEHKGRGADIAPIDRRSFDHRQTGFVLRGGHLPPKAECRACHVPPKKYRDAPSDCNACHKKDDKHKGKLGSACANCHTEINWKQTRFDHGKTRFPLRNAHADVPCAKCHKDQTNFKGAPLACGSCHQKDDRDKGHQGRFGRKCESCHTDRNWETIIFDHERDARYPLKGKHQLARCNACHKGSPYEEKLPKTCVACHRADDMKKGHQGAFGEKCESCHTERDWKTTSFDHDRDTRYPLRGKHAQAKCSGCHIGNQYKGKPPTACLACHRKDDTHKGQLGERCESCHNERSWKDTRFDHGVTRFPLLGKHVKVACKACHTTASYKDARLECIACHAKADKHKLRLGTQCEVCHNARSWKEWEFNHDRRTRFKLEGKHRGLDCLACHRFPVKGRAVLETSCISCHENEDVHNGGFGRLCERCHVASSFKTIKPGSAGRLIP